MEDHRYRDLENRASAIADLDLVRQAEARSRVRKEIKQMLDTGEALTLTSEEDEMLRSFRRFKLRMRKDGETFKWQTRRPEGIQVVDQSAEILHPSEVE